MIVLLIMILTISSLNYKHGTQINGHGWDGTMITPVAPGDTEAWVAAVDLGAAVPGGSW